MQTTALFFHLAVVSKITKATLIQTSLSAQESHGHDVLFPTLFDERRVSSPDYMHMYTHDIIGRQHVKF